MESKISPCPTSRHTNGLALAISFRQIPHVRCVALAAGLLVALAGHASAEQRRRQLPTPPRITPVVAQPVQRQSSNPAFLGIKMRDQGLGCLVEGVTPGSAAQDAGLREWDLIVALDGTQTTTCTALKAQIVGSAPGHIVRLDVRRNAERVVLHAPLSTRAEVLHRRLVGHAMDAADVVDADDDKRSYDLADTRGKTTVIGWFTIAGCSGCSAVFDRVADGLAARLKSDGNGPALVAVTSRAQPVNKAPVTPVLPVRRSYGFTSSVPLALASETTFEELAIDDNERVHFMVIDARGIVRFVAPIAPGSEDIDAAIDEVLAAAEQAEHLRTQRR
jgi:hypothetical protein